MLHGLFHRIQPELEFMAGMSDGSNEHLDTFGGRFWLQLEWRALRRAVASALAGAEGPHSFVGNFEAASGPAYGVLLDDLLPLSAGWCRLNADRGVLRATDGTTRSVPVTAPLEGTPLQGDGWTVILSPGWVVRPAARPGSFVIVREI